MTLLSASKRPLFLACAAFLCAAMAGCVAPGVPDEPTTYTIMTTRTIFIGPELLPCEGVAPMQCMLVRRSPLGEWEFFYDQIAGFTFEPGYFYELEVIVRPVDNPPADASSESWELRRVISKTLRLTPTTAPAR